MSTPIHPRRSLFAFWRRPWWVWCAVLAVMLIVYPLSAVPVGQMLKDSRCLHGPNGLIGTYRTFYGPVYWYARRSVAFQKVMGFQHHIIGRITGEAAARKVRSYLYAPSDPLSPPHDNEWMSLQPNRLPVAHSRD